MYATVVIGLGVLVAAPAPKESPKKDAGIIGEWVGVKMTVVGQDVPVPTGFTFSFVTDGILLVRDGNRAMPETASYTIEPKKDPAEIDLIPPLAKKEPTIVGIYKLDGDTLTLCFNQGGPAPIRPTSFASKVGSTSVVVTFKRAKTE